MQPVLFLGPAEREKSTQKHKLPSWLDLEDLQGHWQPGWLEVGTNYEGLIKSQTTTQFWPKFTGIRHSPLSFLLNLYRSVLIRRLQNPLALLLVSANGYKAYSNAIQIKAVTFQYTQMRTNSINKVINVILNMQLGPSYPEQWKGFNTIWPISFQDYIEWQ